MEETRLVEIIRRLVDEETPRNVTTRQEAREALAMLLAKIVYLQEKCAGMEETLRNMLQDDSQSRMILPHARSNARRKWTMDEILEQNPDMLVLERGGTVRLDEAEGKFLHWCRRCGRTFKSESANPAKCGYCRKKYWRGDWERDVRRVQDDSG